MFYLGLALGAGSAGSLVWFGKDKLLTAIQGATAFASKLEAKAAAIKAATIKAAV